MPQLTLYHAAPSRSSIVHWMLEELGEPYDIHLVSFKKGENRQPAFLAINPMGKLPALTHGDVVITEARPSAPISPTSSRRPSSTYRWATPGAASI